MMNKKATAIIVLLCMISSVLAVGIFSVVQLVGSAATVDPNARYITTTGAGQKNGTSLDNAWGANTTSFSTAWSSTPLNGTLYVGSGTYSNVTVTVSTSGLSQATPKRLIGLDSGGGKPIVKGGFVPPTSVPSTKFVSISSGVKYITIENFRVENYYHAVYTNGNNSYINVSDVDVYVTNDGIRLNGGGTETDTLKTSNIRIENCQFYYYIKTGVRTENRVEDLLVSNCYADAGGQAYFYPKNWPVGFSMTAETPELAEKRFTFVDCTAMNSFENSTSYYNGDGFTTERGIYDVSFIRCKSFSATDAGWDSKADNVTLMDCVGMDNKRNFKLWSTGQATMINCLSAYALSRGGGSSCGLIVNGGGRNTTSTAGIGRVVAYNSTFYNNKTAQLLFEGGSITLNDCIVGTDTSSNVIASYNPNYQNNSYKKNNTVEYVKGVSGTDPKIKAPSATRFYGDSDIWNSQLYGNTKGYYWVAAPNRSLLNDKLIEARDLYRVANANIGSGVGKYDAATVLGLSSAITAAENVNYYSFSAKQSDIDAQVSKLSVAIASCTTIVATPTPTPTPVPTPTPTPTPVPEPTIPPQNISVNNNGTITNPYGKVGKSIVRANVTGIFNPEINNKVVMINGVAAEFTYYNGVYKFVALVEGSVTPSSVSVVNGIPTRLIYADINFNTVTDATDVNLLKGSVSGNRAAAGYFELLASDVTGDGFVNASDYNSLKGYITGNLEKLAVNDKA